MKGFIAFCFLVLTLFCASRVKAQIVNTATMDTLETTVIGRVAIGGYIDAYWSYNFNGRGDQYLPYAISSSRNNELNINLTYVDLRYRSDRLRARIVPGFGTYMNDNYTNESGTLKNIVEANAGVLLSKERKIWLDAGVLGSPYTNESAISKDHLMYTRSLAPENVPYYLSGVKLSVPVSAKVNAYFYLLNGWQVIEDNNEGKSLGTQLEYRPNSKMLINWNTYFGDERSTLRPQFRQRTLMDFFWIYKPSPKWDFTSSAYVGWQEQQGAQTLRWGQFNVIGRYTFNAVYSLSGRLEYFHDPHQVMVTAQNGVGRFQTYTTGLCLNIKFTDNAMLRFESKYLFSNDSIYQNENGTTSSNFLMVGNLTAWF